ncbi:MAG TPA: antitoxin [Thermoanaerobaculia bacterium]|nr:antitoxin [Thermoanaerobaculia bacterium]
MRTTLELDDDILEAARALALAAKSSLGSVVSDLVRKGLAPRLQVAKDQGFPVFEVDPEAPPITLDTVRRAEES